MKHFFEPYLRSTAVLVGGSLLFSFLFSVLYYFNWIGLHFYQLGCIGCGAILYGICGILFAKQAKKKVLLQALLILVFITLIGLFCLPEITLSSLVSLIIKGCSFLGCVVFLISRH